MLNENRVGECNKFKTLGVNQVCYMLYQINQMFLRRYLISFIKMELFVPAYLKNTYLFELDTQIAAKKDGMVEFVDTIFHPQGGGQPNDKGWVCYNKNGQLVKQEILGAQSDRQTGKIYYKIGEIDNFNVGDKIKIQIDKQTRIKNAKLHSAGHLIDLAVQRLKYQWQTAKGYHFQDNPYVQYKGKIQDVGKVTSDINTEIQKIIKEGIPTVKQVFSYNDAVQKGLIPQTFKTPLIRVIHFATSNCPCGGTHIENSSEMQSLKITKVQKKGKSIKVYYSVQ